MIKIKHMGDTWRILAERSWKDGMVLCHLASTTRFPWGPRGGVPLQMEDWVPQEAILGGAVLSEEEQRQDHITEFYMDRALSRSPIFGYIPPAR